METYDEEYYSWLCATIEQRFEIWVEQVECYFEEREHSGVAINCL